MTNYSKLKVAELKDLVKERHITATGLKLKQHFIDALEADDAQGGDAVAEGESVELEHAAATAAAVADMEVADAKVEDKSEVKERAESPQASEVVDQADSGDVAEVNETAIETPENANKRKRRSPTPPPREESVSKKLKMAEEKAEDDEQVKLPEHVSANVPAPAPADEHGGTQEKVMQLSTGDDVMKMTEGELAVREEVAKEVDAQPTKDFDSPPATAQGIDGPTPAEHHATRALYICKLVRPLKVEMLREHLLSVSQPPIGTSGIEACHLAKLRTHALVIFDSVSAASRARAALHDKRYPDEPMRKPLWVDFVPDDKVQEWIDTEVSRTDMTRWEVVYDSAGPDTDGPVAATHQEAGGVPSSIQKPSSNSGLSRPLGVGEGMPNAPLGPRRRSTQVLPPREPSPETGLPRQDKSFHSLDERYKFTETKPKLYWQPVARDLAARRLNEIGMETSRDWDDRQANPANYAERELRRYTFEDGDRLVDGGADFGSFGKVSARGGFRGRGGGRGRGSDSYRGGGWRR